MSRILLVVDVPWAFVMNRLSLAEHARAQGFDVHIASGVGGGEEPIIARGFPYHPLRLSRKGRNPLVEAWNVLELTRLYRRLRPDLVHHVTLKPILYGSLAARLAGVPAIVNAFAGLGYAFTESGKPAVAVTRTLLATALAAAVPRQRTINVFENPDDRAVMVQAGVCTPENGRVLPGVGIDVDAFRPSPEPAGRVRVTLAARMLREKGVMEFVAAARMLRGEGVDVEFVLAGAADPANPGSLSEAELSELHAQGDVQWLGFHKDMASLLSGSHVVCLPSYYREGIPRALLEGAACGRPLVAADVPGCREIVRDGVNGLLVKARDAEGLANAVRSLARDPETRRRFGAAGRRIVEQEYALPIVLRKMTGVYAEVLAA